MATRTHFLHIFAHKTRSRDVELEALQSWALVAGIGGP